MKRILLTIAVVLFCGSASAFAVDSPAPVGASPGANFEWKHLDGIGYGWVEKGIKAIDFKTHITVGSASIAPQPLPLAVSQPAPAPVFATPVRTGIYQFLNAPIPGCAGGQCKIPGR